MIASAIAIMVALFFIGWGAYVGLNARRVNEEWFLAAKGIWWLRVLAIMFVIAGVVLAMVTLSGLARQGGLA
jgi:hypothetical protein